MLKRRVDPSTGVRTCLTTLIACGLCAACAVPIGPVPDYVPPSGGKTAKLIMRGQVVAGDVYGVYLLGDSERCALPRLVGRGDQANHPTSTVIQAQRVTTVEFLLVKPNKQHCAIRYSFTPQTGKSYLLRGQGLESGCMASVSDASDPAQIKLAPGVLRRNPGTNSCLPLSQAQAISTQEDSVKASGGEAVLRQGATTKDLQGLIGQ